MNTKSSAWSRLLAFGVGLLILQATWGCGSDDPAKELIEVIIDIRPGVYDVSSSIIFSCPDTTTEPVVLDSTGISCVFDVTGPLQGIFGLTVVDAVVQQPPEGHYFIEILTELRQPPCLYYQLLVMEGMVTDTSLFFTSKTSVDTVLSTDNTAEALCLSDFKAAFKCTTYQTFEATWVSADTANICGVE